MKTLLAAAGLCTLLIAGPVVAQAPVRVMSYNIRYDNPADQPPWPDRRGPMAGQIAFVAPDVLGLQEALPTQVAWLVQALPGYDAYGVGRDDGADAGETTTLMWRRDRFEKVDAATTWCSPTPERPSRGWDADFPRTVTRVILRDRRDGRLWVVRNTHFDHVGEQARAECASQIAGQIATDPAHAAVVVMGDFNAGPDSEPIRRLVTAGLKDARVISPIAFGPAGTYNAFDIARDNDGVAIDHVFVGKGLEVLRFGVPTDSVGGRVISDHFPVVADVSPTP